MTDLRFRAPSEIARLVAAVARVTCVLLATLWGLPATALAQDANAVRSQIRQSGLSSDEIRNRLRAGGFDPALLDPYLIDNPSSVAPDLNPTALAALAALGVDPALPEGVEDAVIEAGFEANIAGSGSDGLELFGLNVFRGRTTQFQPLLSGPAPPDYRFGPGDVAVLVLTGEVESVYELSVTREGFVVVPQVGQIFVNSLTLEQTRQLLRRRLGTAYSGIASGSTQFDISVARMRTIQVFVIGEVAQPGAYQLASVATVLNALYASGGPTERGNFREVQVRRGRDTIATLDLYDYFLDGNKGNDITLDQGDVVFVPLQGVRAAIRGEILRPAIYELKPDQTLRDLVDAAGGFRPDAALLRISISRIVPPRERTPLGLSRVVVDVPIDQIEDGRAPPFPIEPGDQVTIFAIPDGRNSVVELEGSVYHPGTYAWRPGMRLSELVELAGGFRPGVFPGRAHIERLNTADSTRFLLPIRLPSDSTQPYPDDLELQDHDRIRVYNSARLRGQRLVAILGEVNEPGVQAFSTSMTARDLILRAGGLTDGAYLDSVEIASIPDDRTGGTLAVTRRVPLDSTYIFEPPGSTFPQLPGFPTIAPASGTPEIPLAPYDVITVFRKPDYELTRVVVVTGEVRFPGRYAVTAKSERVSDLIRRAGGVLTSAYVDGARFFRRFGGAGRIDLDLTRALDRPTSAADIFLQPDDSLHIPEYIPTVRVQGAVNAPVSVLYSAGKGLGYYIANAGGYQRNADKARLSVRYANGSARTRGGFLFFRSYPSPGPGSTVNVPARDPSTGFDTRGLITDLVAITASLATVIIVASR